MSMTDPIADMLTRIRNAVKARHDRVSMPASRTKVDILRLMKDSGYIQNYKVLKESGRDVIKIALRYEAGKSSILGLKRVSSPGRRIYCSKDEIPHVRSGYGTTIITTSKGVMTDAQAREQGLGGEVLLTIW